MLPADKGFIDTVRQALLAKRQGIIVITLSRKGMGMPHRPMRLKACGCIRKYVEEVELLKRASLRLK